MLAICIAVQQLESNVLSPFLMGKAVDVHPLVILLSVAAGTYVFGFVGALFMVPVIATVRSMAVYVNGVDPFPVLGNGGSALTDPPKKLMGSAPTSRTPAPRGRHAGVARRRDRGRGRGRRRGARRHVRLTPRGVPARPAPC